MAAGFETLGRRPAHGLVAPRRRRRAGRRVDRARRARLRRRLERQREPPRDERRAVRHGGASAADRGPIADAGRSMRRSCWPMRSASTPTRRVALENDVLACVSRPGCAVLLVAIDGDAGRDRAPRHDRRRQLPLVDRHPAGVPRARARARSRRRSRSRDALDAGSAVIHLAVEVDNDPALRLYERLGFATVGEPAPDLLLR